jgi:hypothetical protein
MRFQSKSCVPARSIWGAFVSAVLFAGTAFSAAVPQVTGSAVFSAGMTTPVAVATDPAGNFYVADQRGGGVVKLGADGRFLGTMPTAAPPIGVAVSSSGTVAVSLGASVVLLDQSGTKTGQLGSGSGEFGIATGIAFDDTGNIYVADGIRNCVAVYTPSGAFLSRFGTSGSGNGQFSMPTAIAFEKVSRQMAVADTMNGRIQFFSLSGTWAKTLGSFGSGPLLFTSPQGVAFEYAGAPAALSRIYVVDSFQSNIQAISPEGSGAYLSTIGSYGFGPGELIVPTGLLFDPLRFRLVAVNGFGNLTLYTIDGGSQPPVGTPPALTLNTVPAQSGVASVTLSGTVAAGASVLVRNDTTGVSGAAAVSGNVWSYPAALVAGTNSLTVTASNSAGNTVLGATITYNAAVAISISPLPSLVAKTTQAVQGTMENGATVTVALSAGTAGAVVYPTATTWQTTLTGLRDGDTTVTVTATKGGNSATATAVVVVDTVAPAVVLSALSAGSVTSDQVQNVSGTVTDAHPGTLSVNGAAAELQADGSFTFPIVLLPGSNTVSVKATDAAGNTATQTTGIVFVRDATRIAVTEPADGAVVTAPLLLFQGTVDRAATVSAGGIPAPVSGGAWNAQVNLSAGMNTVEIAATDAAGAVSKVKRTVFLDITAVDVEVGTPGQDVAVNAAPLITVRTSASGSIGYTFNGSAGTAPVSGGTAALPISFGAQGTYPLVVSATDGSGSTVTTVRNLVFDTTPPAFTMNAASGIPATVSGTVEPGASVAVYDRNGAAGTAVVTGGSWNAALTAGYDPGSLVAAATDAAGNVSVKALNPALPDGDMNGDGVVTAADALIAMRIYMGLLKPTAKELALYLAHGDVAPLVAGKPTRDGIIDLADALLILRRAVGQITW